MKDNVLSDLVNCEHINMIDNFKVVTGFVYVAGTPAEIC